MTLERVPPDENKSSDSELLKILKKCIDDIQEKFPRLSESEIAKKLRIANSTWSRIKNPKTLPNVETFLRVVLGSGNIQYLFNVLSSGDDELLGNIKEKIYEVIIKDHAIKTTENFENDLNDPDMFVAFLLCSMPKGITLKDAEQVIGKKAKDCLNWLLTKQYITEVHEHFIAVQKGVMTRSKNHIKHHLTTYAKYYQTDHWGRNRNYVHSLTDGLNQNGLQKVRALHKKFHQELEDVMRNAENRGDIPVFSVAFCDTFTTIDNDQLSH